MERRNSVRVPTRDILVREKNGDYLYHLEARDLAEEGIFLKQKVVTSGQDYVSYLKFTLPDGTEIDDVPARMVRADKSKAQTGVAYEFVTMDEELRMALKRYVLQQSA